MKTKILILFGLFTIYLNAQTNYYVSTTGSNTNSGTESNPFKTIQHGLNQLKPNNILHVMNGTYNEQVVINTDNIILKNYKDHKPIIDASDLNSSLLAIIAIYEKTDITISGFELRNNMKNFVQGIVVEGSGDNITIENCKIHNINFSKNSNDSVNHNTNAQGIVVYGTGSSDPVSNLKIRNNEIYNCRLGFSEGLAVNGNVENFEISNNNVHDLTNIGIIAAGNYKNSDNPGKDQARNGTIKNNITYNCASPYAASAGIYTDGGKNLIIENNISYNNSYGIEIGCEIIGKLTNNITVRNNIIYNNIVTGIAVGGFDYPNGSGTVKNVSITNNTCFKNDTKKGGLGEIFFMHGDNFLVENNIFYTSNQNKLTYTAFNQNSTTFNYNLIFCDAGEDNLKTEWNNKSYYNFNDFVNGSNTNKNSIFGNPKFKNAQNNDFHLESDSKAIDAGNPNYIPNNLEVDIDNESRKVNIIDCGADEFASTLGFDENIEQKITFAIHPNPAKEQLNFETTDVIEKVSVYTITGKLLKEFKTIENNQITVSTLKSGLYLFKVKTNKGLFTKKIMLQQ